jgi:hypothetical protein
MKFIPFILSIIMAAHCYGSASIGEYLSRTNKPSIPEKPDSSVVVAPALPAGLIAQGDFYRPAISPDGLSVACEGPKMGSVYLYERSGETWKGGKIVTASKDTALRTYVVDILDRIVSWRYGKKDGGKLHGPGLYENGKERYSGLTTGAARMAKAKDGVILLSKNGAWLNLATGRRGQYAMPDSGEKFDFAISGDSWAAGVNGYSKRASYVSVNGKLTTVADYAKYRSQGDDLNYPSILINGKDVWFASVYDGLLYVQCVTDGKTRWPINALPAIGKANMQDRCPPRLIILTGLVTVIYVQGGTIYRADVEGVLQGKSKPVAICKGAYPDVSANGLMVYVDGGLRVKKL